MIKLLAFTDISIPVYMDQESRTIYCVSGFTPDRYTSEQNDLGSGSRIRASATTAYQGADVMLKLANMKTWTDL